MSDFSYTAKCPGCKRKFAPDDGACCVPCHFCGKYDLPWHRHSYNEDIEDYVCDECEPYINEDGELMDDIDMCAAYKW
jgi:hypothetical protein